MSSLIYPDLLAWRMASQPDDVAIVDGGNPETLRELVHRAWQVAHVLRLEALMAPADRFAVVAGNSARYASLWQAAAWGGGVVVPINTRLSDAELAALLAHAAPTVVFVDASHAARVAAMRSSLPSVRMTVSLDDSDVPVDVGFEDLVEGIAPSPPESPSPDAPALLMYTGGTTGRPKGVLHSQRNLCVGGVIRTSSFMDLSMPGARIYQSPPMFHIMAIVGNLVMPAAGGVTVVPHQLDPGSMLADIDEHRITHIAAVPTLLSMLLEHPDYDPVRLRSLRRIAYGGARMPEALLRRFLDELPQVGFINSYGMTEVAGSLTALSPEDHRQGHALGSVGRALVGVELRAVGPDGLDMALGGAGEIVTRCGSQLVEYWHAPDLTAAVTDGEWYRTGDLGRIDEDGYVHILDRVDDMIISGGENIYASEVEAAIAPLPQVLQVAVLGLPHDRWGQAVHAVVVVRPGSELSEASIVEHCRKVLAGYKVPKTVEIRFDPLPLTGANKVQKHLLREAAITSQTA